MGIANRIGRCAIISLKVQVIVEILGIFLFTQQSGASSKNSLAQ
jgi:hypothetical protein